MNYIKLDELQKVLENVSKDIIIEMYYEEIRFSKIDLRRKIIDVKMSVNLRQQREVLDKIDEHGQCDTKDLVKWRGHHIKWQKLNDEYNKLDELYNKLYIERNKLEGERE